MSPIPIYGGSSYNDAVAIGAGAAAIYDNCSSLIITNSEIKGGNSSGSTLGCGIESSVDFAEDQISISVTGSTIKGGDRNDAAFSNPTNGGGQAIYMYSSNVVNLSNFSVELTNTNLYSSPVAEGLIIKDNITNPLELDVSGILNIMPSSRPLANATVNLLTPQSYISGANENVTLRKPYLADTATIGFEKVEDNRFDIVLSTDQTRSINEFVAAELKFDNTSTTESGAKMAYEIIGTEDITVEKNLEKQDTFLFNLKADKTRPTSNRIVLGQVSFIGYGNIAFGVNSTYENTVTATLEGTHLADYFTTQNNRLIIGAAANSRVEMPTRAVEVSFDFTHPVNTLATEEYLGVKAVLKDIYGNITEKTLASTSSVITFDAIPVGRITLTLSAPGYRTYVYTTVLEEGATALPLSFWTDVKRDTLASPLAEIEAGKGAIATSFLVGDIAMDYIIDKYDLAAVTSYYGMYGITSKTPEEIAKLVKYDLNRDGSIDITDVGYVLHTMGH